MIVVAGWFLGPGRRGPDEQSDEEKQSLHARSPELVEKAHARNRPASGVSRPPSTCAGHAPREVRMMKRFAGFQRARVFGGVTVDRIARSAATPVMGASNPGTVSVLPGGVGLNAASVLARLGLTVTLVARVGADGDGDMVTAAAAAAGIDVGAIAVSPAAPTATYHASFDNNGGLIIGIADMRLYDELTPAAVAPALAAAGPNEAWVVDANLPAETLAFLAGEAHDAGHPLAALSVSPVKALRLAPIIDRITLLIATRREAAAILGREWSGGGPAARDLAAALVAGGAGGAIVTDSADPLAVALGSETRAFAPFRATVASVNGAGDAFAAGTLYGLASGKTLFEAVMPGLAAAALTVESADTARHDLTPALLAHFLTANGNAA
ncbi:MAG: PfkB family carbohydrate kinase [Bauldia sp.]